jgi:nickel superoxide dismutase
MIQEAIAKLVAKTAVETVSAHCDGPCGVYDPASARIAAEAALSMTKKIIALGPADTDSNTYSRFVSIKEEQAHLAKTELLVLWTDYFKPEHLEACPDLHEKFWNAAKLCSAVKQGIDEDAANALMAAIEDIHNVFWSSKGREVDYYVAT